MSSIQTVHAEDAPPALGPYSSAVIANGQIFTSGQIGMNQNCELVGEDVRSQTRQVFKNLQAVLRSANSDLNRVIKTTVFLQDMNDFAAMNEVYAEMFGDHRPARSAFQVARLPKDARVEIELVALPNA
ncbi:hypothetical protein H4R33_001802 [Dimargaris cristalligena]|uniref:Endoribonuclease L-PSP n=1 Tax=Dimargaris cristalligena TaxID=215637 RepID=A0A4P9ZSF2_9FUNG|nr:hypothetical protein H4R33_001802 [Dimargaris cristalligena]RKP36403.1 endoribonuclease L-PSP [Dimargaris cristalligena]|eukprot:RKP36403.1 endoribonuclease L-PSP [Dimargaris cristalligena]